MSDTAFFAITMIFNVVWITYCLTRLVAPETMKTLWAFMIATTMMGMTNTICNRLAEFRYGLKPTYPTEKHSQP